MWEIILFHYWYTDHCMSCHCKWIQISIYDFKSNEYYIIGYLPSQSLMTCISWTLAIIGAFFCIHLSTHPSIHSPTHPCICQCLLPTHPPIHMSVTHPHIHPTNTLKTTQKSPPATTLVPYGGVFSGSTLNVLYIAEDSLYILGAH